MMPAQLGRAHRLLEKKPAGQANPPSGHLGQGDGYCDHAHAADLNQRQNHHLSKKGPAGSGVQHD